MHTFFHWLSCYYMPSMVTKGERTNYVTCLYTPYLPWEKKHHLWNKWGHVNCVIKARVLSEKRELKVKRNCWWETSKKSHFWAWNGKMGILLEKIKLIVQMGKELRKTCTAVSPHPQFCFQWFPLYTANYGPKILNGKFQK